MKLWNGTAWVDTSYSVSADEVFVGPAEPPTTYELWVDSDDASGIDTTALAKLPKGLVAYHALQAEFRTTAPHTTAQDSGLTVTITEPVNRYLKAIVTGNYYVPGGVNSMNVLLLRNGVAVRQFDIPSEALAAGYGHTATFVTYLGWSVGGSGVVYKVQIKAGLNGTSVADYAGGALHRSLLIEDIGGP